EDILACQQGGMTPYVPKPLTSGAKAEGRFGKQDFVYVATDNTYRCPAGESLTWRFASVEHGGVLHSYWTTQCENCACKAQCTTGSKSRHRTRRRRLGRSLGTGTSGSDEAETASRRGAGGRSACHQRRSLAATARHGEEALQPVPLLVRGPPPRGRG